MAAQGTHGVAAPLGMRAGATDLLKPAKMPSLTRAGLGTEDREDREALSELDIIAPAHAWSLSLRMVKSNTKPADCIIALHGQQRCMWVS